MHHKAFVAWCGFALGARQGIFLARLRMQKHREIFAHSLIAQCRHVSRRCAYHHPIFVFDRLTQKGIANGPAHTENLHRHGLRRFSEARQALTSLRILCSGLGPEWLFKIDEVFFGQGIVDPSFHAGHGAQALDVGLCFC